MFFKALDLYFLVLIFLVCDSAIAADGTGITTDQQCVIFPLTKKGKGVTFPLDLGQSKTPSPYIWKLGTLEFVSTNAMFD